MTNKGLGAIKTHDEWMILVKKAAEDYTGTLWRENGGCILEDENGWFINVYDYTDEYAEAFIYGYLNEYVASLIEEEKEFMKEG